MLVQAGGSPRGIRASAYVADVVFGADMPLAMQVRQRKLLDEALAGLGKYPAEVGILWQTPICIAETEREALARRDQLLGFYPPEAVGAYLSYNCGYDFAKLPESFTLRKLHDEIIASQASPMGFLHELSAEIGAETRITRKEFLEYGLRDATNYDATVTGTPAQVADRLEEVFEATGSRGGFMLGHAVAMPLDLIGIADLLVPELQRRGRFRREYRYRTLKDNMRDNGPD